MNTFQAKINFRRFTAESACSAAFWTTFGMGIVITAALFLFRRPFLRISGTSDVTFVYADTYFSIISAFMVPALLNITLFGQMRNEGATAKATQGMLIGMIALVIFCCFHFISGRSVLSIHPKDFKPNARMYEEIMTILKDRKTA